MAQLEAQFPCKEKVVGSIMGLLLTKHLVFDFFLQSPFQYLNKGTDGQSGRDSSRFDARLLVVSSTCKHHGTPRYSFCYAYGLVYMLLRRHHSLSHGLVQDLMVQTTELQAPY